MVFPVQTGHHAFPPLGEGEKKKKDQQQPSDTLPEEILWQSTEEGRWSAAQKAITWEAASHKSPRGVRKPSVNRRQTSPSATAVRSGTIMLVQRRAYEIRYRVAPLKHRTTTVSACLPAEKQCSPARKTRRKTNLERAKNDKASCRHCRRREITSARKWCRRTTKEAPEATTTARKWIAQSVATRPSTAVSASNVGQRCTPSPCGPIITRTEDEVTTRRPRATHATLVRRPTLVAAGSGGGVGSYAMARRARRKDISAGTHMTAKDC